MPVVSEGLVHPFPVWGQTLYLSTGDCVIMAVFAGLLVALMMLATRRAKVQVVHRPCPVAGSAALARSLVAHYLTEFTVPTCVLCGPARGVIPPRDRTP